MMRCVADAVPVTEGHWINCRWIPVSERLPKHHGNVLTYSKRGNIYIHHMGNFGKWNGSHPDSITHWMPLPWSPQELEEMKK